MREIVKLATGKTKGINKNRGRKGKKMKLEKKMK